MTFFGHDLQDVPEKKLAFDRKVRYLIMQKRKGFMIAEKKNEDVPPRGVLSVFSGKEKI